MKDISLYIIAKNEADKLKACIESARKIVSEIIVVESGSTDNTAQVAEELGAKVFQHEFKGFADQKNFALSKCSCKWALCLDADENLSEELASEIAAIPDNTEYSGFQLLRVNYFLGGLMKHGGFANEYVLRLTRKDAGKYKNVLVHESIELEGKVCKLKKPVMHFPYADLFSYFEKFNRYTTLAARDLNNKGRKFSLIGTLFRLPFEFLKRFILKMGCLDGIRGFIWASISTYYVFVKYIKLWDLQRKKN